MHTTTFMQKGVYVYSCIGTQTCKQEAQWTITSATPSRLKRTLKVIPKAFFFLFLKPFFWTLKVIPKALVVACFKELFLNVLKVVSRYFLG